MAKKDKPQWPLWKRSAKRYVVAAVLCGFFSAVYEYFSHGVVSYWMVCLGLIPLLAGALPVLVLGFLGVRVHVATRELWACGVLALALGSCLMGVLEIYGTTSPYVGCYVIAAAVPLVLAAISHALLSRGAA